VSENLGKISIHSLYDKSQTQIVNLLQGSESNDFNPLTPKRREF